MSQDAELREERELARRTAERMWREHQPPGIEGMDAFDFAEVAAEEGWPVDEVAPRMAQAFGITEQVASELLLGERSMRLDRELKEGR